MLQLILALILLGGAFAIVGYVVYCFFTAPKTVVVTPLKGVDDAVVTGAASSSGGAEVVSTVVEPIKVGTPVVRNTTFMERLSWATKKSATLLVQLGITAFGLLGNGILLLGDFLVGPDFRAWVSSAFTPEVATGLVAFMVLITTLSRARTMFTSGT